MEEVIKRKKSERKKLTDLREITRKVRLLNQQPIDFPPNEAAGCFVLTVYSVRFLTAKIQPLRTLFSPR